MSVIPERLSVLFISPMAPSPPQFGAQARTHGLLSHLGQRHDIHALILHEDVDTPDVSGPAMRSYCREVTFVRNPKGASGWRRRLLQFRSWCSRRSFQRHQSAVPEFEKQLNRVLDNQRFDVVFVNFPHLAHYDLRRSPEGAAPPVVIIDSHDIHYDLARQISRSNAPFGRRLHAALNWQKLMREELTAYSEADGVCVCSDADRLRLATDAPAASTFIIPNAADVEYFQPRDSYPRGDGRTVLFFGLLSTIPNQDGVQYFLREIWPRIFAARPGFTVRRDRGQTFRGAAGAGRIRHRNRGAGRRSATTPGGRDRHSGAAAAWQRHTPQDP